MRTVTDFSTIPPSINWSNPKSLSGGLSERRGVGDGLRDLLQLPPGGRNVLLVRVGQRGARLPVPRLRKLSGPRHQAETGQDPEAHLELGLGEVEGAAGLVEGLPAVQRLEE